MRRPRLAVAVAASVMGVSGCTAQDPADLAGPSPSGGVSPSPGAPSPAPSAAPSVAAAPDRAQAEAAVAAFLDVLGRDSERAWDLLTQRAQQGFGSFERFASTQSAYSEGLAQFAGARSRYLELGAGLGVLTLSGDITREGTTEYGAVALPVRAEGGRTRIELAAQALQVEIEVPSWSEPAPSLPPGTELVAYVHADARVTVAVDGITVEAEESAADGDRTRVSVRPDLVAGRHVLTVSAVRADGLLVADAGAFTVQA